MIADLPEVATYLDNLMITGKIKTEHWENLEKLLARLQEYHFRIRKEKCNLFKPTHKCLEHIIDKK